MAGTSEGGKKAAMTRGHESLSRAGRKGGRNSHANQKPNDQPHDSPDKGGRKEGSIKKSE